MKRPLSDIRPFGPFAQSSAYSGISTLMFSLSVEDRRKLPEDNVIKSEINQSFPTDVLVDVETSNDTPLDSGIILMETKVKGMSKEDTIKMFDEMRELAENNDARVLEISVRSSEK